MSKGPVQLSDLQAIARGERCSLQRLYVAIAVGFCSALALMFLTWNALAGVLGGCLIYFGIVLAGSANGRGKVQ
jgi:hypothetical protein